MKSVIFVRHAKSSWDNPDLSDFDRPLNKRGLKDAPFMAQVLAQMNIKPDKIISSPAIRALTTARHFAEKLDYPINDISTHNDIYEKGANAIINIITNLDNNLNCIMLFGHNPDLHHLVTYLSDLTIDNLPTCGIVCIDFNVASWSDIKNSKGVIRFFEYPKKYA